MGGVVGDLFSQSALAPRTKQESDHDSVLLAKEIQSVWRDVWRRGLYRQARHRPDCAQQQTTTIRQ
ncbi:hypothetical protein GCM10009550_76430 [Actinocorallia libanotica]|uniref:Uncharacterized protein n=1 Tax=Actinocorallia libanotica TaxID=46162 RepID=A0ABN1S0V3_9ACTN